LRSLSTADVTSLSDQGALDPASTSRFEANRVGDSAQRDGGQPIGVTLAGTPLDARTGSQTRTAHALPGRRLPNDAVDVFDRRGKLRGPQGGRPDLLHKGGLRCN